MSSSPITVRIYSRRAWPTRDYVYGFDLADAHGKALEYLGGGRETTVLNLGIGVGVALEHRDGYGD